MIVGGQAINSRSLACDHLLLLSALIILAIRLWPELISHDGERDMVDGPGMVVGGVCCVEPLHHFLNRVIWPIAALLMAVSFLLPALLERLLRPKEQVEDEPHRRRELAKKVLGER